MPYSIGVDIGGTKVASAIINQKSEILFRSEVDSNTSDSNSMFKQVITSIEEVIKKSKLTINDITGMGVGVPGKVDCQHGVAVYQNNLPWRGFPITNKLKNYFSIENITIDNDVYMAAFAEWKLANIDRQDTFVYLTISTGISCSIIHNGSFIRGNGFAGEIGLLPVIAKSSPNGVAGMEQSVSGTAIQKLAEKKFNKKGLSIADFFQAYNDNHPVAHSTMNEITKSLAHGVYSIVCLLDPHSIVFGGGVITKNPFLLDLIKNEIKTFSYPEQTDVLDKLNLCNLKENSGIVGAGLKGLSFSE